MEILGYVSAVLIGISLGLIGGGGSSLAMPVLVYLFHVKAQAAVSDSFFIVGLTSLIGAITYISQKQISYKSALLFGLPSILGVYVAHRIIWEAIPQQIAIGSLLPFSKDTFVLVLFSLLMILASVSMIRPIRLVQSESSPVTLAGPKLFAGGFGVGILAGLVGAGGGFLIIPALVNLVKLPMKKAIGTSLLIISINSAIGLLSSSNNQAAFDWHFLLLFSTFSAAGIFAGMLIAKRVSGNMLKPAFGWFILAIGSFIISQQIIRIH